MYCSKCGTKAIDGALFCQKCGAKLVRDNGGEQGQRTIVQQESKEASIPSVEPISRSEQKSVREEEPVLENESNQVSVPESIEMPVCQTEPVIEMMQKEEALEEPLSVSEDNEDIYALLEENIDKCPIVRSAKRVKKGVRLRGKIFSHFVRLSSVRADRIRMKSILAIPFSVLYGLPICLFCILAWMILAEIMKYGSICIEYYHGIFFALCFLSMGAVLLIHSFAGCKEKDDVAAYVHRIAELKHIYLLARKRTGMSKIRIAVAGVLVVTGIIVLSFNLPEPMEYPDELLFGSLPVTRFLDMTQKDLESEFGEAEWIGQNMTTGDDYYNYSYDGLERIKHVTYSKETGKVIYIQFEAAYCTCNRKNLNKSLERVVDILYDRYRGYASFGVYGSIHNGFYHDGVYFGETLSTEEYLDQQRFEDARDSYCCFMPLTVFGEEYYDASWSLIGREKQDYNIDLIIDVWKNNEDLSGVYDVCLYTDEWVETVDAADLSFEQTYMKEADSSNTGEVSYKGIPLSSLFSGSAVQTAEVLGLPAGQDRDDDIRLYISDTGEVESIEIWNVGALAFDGEPLEKNRDGLIAIWGEPAEEGYSGGGYVVEYLFDTYCLYFELGEPEDVAWRITVSSVQRDDIGNDVPYSETTSTYGETDMGNLCYGKFPIMDLLYKDTDEVCNVLGFPTDGTPINGELLFGGTEYYAYDGLLLYFDNQTDTVARVSAQSDFVKINGETLDKNRTELISLLGQPTYEGYYYDESGEFSDCYYMQYTLYEKGVILDIEMPDLTESADSVTIYEYKDGPEDDGYESYDDIPNLGYGLEWVEAPYITTDELGFNVINGVIENTSAYTKGTVLIYFDLYDMNGYKIDRASDSIQNLKDGDKWKFRATVLSNDAAYWEFSNILAY